MAPAPHLDGGYTIFGEVVGGMEVVEAVNKLAVKGRDSPKGEGGFRAGMMIVRPLLVSQQCITGSSPMLAMHCVLHL